MMNMRRKIRKLTITTGMMLLLAAAGAGTAMAETGPGVESGPGVATESGTTTGTEVTGTETPWASDPCGAYTWGTPFFFKDYPAWDGSSKEFCEGWRRKPHEQMTESEQMLIAYMAKTYKGEGEASPEEKQRLEENYERLSELAKDQIGYETGIGKTVRADGIGPIEGGWLSGC